MGDSLLIRSFRLEIKLPLLEFAFVVWVAGVDGDNPSCPDWCPRRPLCGDWWGDVRRWVNRLWSGASEVGEVGYPESLGSPKLMPTSSMFSKLTRGTSITCRFSIHSPVCQPGLNAGNKGDTTSSVTLKVHLLVIQGSVLRLTSALYVFCKRSYILLNGAI